jgi:hypothetical protein
MVQYSKNSILIYLARLDKDKECIDLDTSLKLKGKTEGKRFSALSIANSLSITRYISAEF